MKLLHFPEFIYRINHDLESIDNPLGSSSYPSQKC
jgi:hypothetical protein